jgi:mannose-6-phosphate isomerase-like protein (cupin superfamily)
MAGYTKLNLKNDVEDMATKFGMSPNLEYRVGSKPLEAQESAVSYLRMAPNFRMPFGHKHERQEEIYVLVDGSAQLKLDDEIIDLQRWDTVRIPKETVRNLEAGPDGAELILIGAPNTGPNDAETLQGWWTENGG